MGNSIKGRIKARAPINCVQSMHKGQEAYILSSSILVTRGKIYIDRLTPVISHHECGKYPDENMVLIRRLDKGHDDYQLDITKTQAVFNVEDDSKGRQLDREEDMYVIVTDFGIRLIEEPVSDAPKTAANDKATLPRLEALLKKALEKEDYLKAISLRDRINRKKEAMLVNK